MKRAFREEYEVFSETKKGIATIYFLNGKFDKVDFTFDGKRNYTRSDWKTLAYINEAIGAIEDSLIKAEVLENGRSL